MPAKRELSMRQLRHLLPRDHHRMSAREIGRRLGAALDDPGQSEVRCRFLRRSDPLFHDRLTRVVAPTTDQKHEFRESDGSAPNRNVGHSDTEINIVLFQSSILTWLRVERRRRRRAETALSRWVSVRRDCSFRDRTCHAAADASRQVFIASARSVRWVYAEVRWRWTLKVLKTAACIDRNLCAEPALLKRCNLSSRRRVG